jgi:hypothetical protein
MNTNTTQRRRLVPLPDSSVREFGKLMVEEDWASVREEDSAGVQEEALQDILTRYLDKCSN